MAGMKCYQNLIYLQRNPKILRVGKNLNYHQMRSKDFIKSEKVEIASKICDIVHDKILKREPINDFEEKVFSYQSKWGKHYGTKEMVKSGMIDHYINNMDDPYNVL